MARARDVQNRKPPLMSPDGKTFVSSASGVCRYTRIPGHRACWRRSEANPVREELPGLAHAAAAAPRGGPHVPRGRRSGTARGGCGPREPDGDTPRDHRRTRRIFGGQGVQARVPTVDGIVAGRAATGEGRRLASRDHAPVPTRVDGSAAVARPPCRLQSPKRGRSRPDAGERLGDPRGSFRARVHPIHVGSQPR